jgi:hypothetical protein
MTRFKKVKKDKGMLQHTHTNLFTKVTEEVDEMACNSDSDTEMVGDYTNHSVVKLGRSNNITKQCSPVFWVELAKKRGRPPKLK